MLIRLFHSATKFQHGLTFGHKPPNLHITIDLCLLFKTSTDGSGRIYTLTPETYSSVLVLENIREEDAGQYSCLFLPNLRATVTLNIESKYMLYYLV